MFSLPRRPSFVWQQIEDSANTKPNIILVFVQLLKNFLRSIFGALQKPKMQTTLSLSASGHHPSQRRTGEANKKPKKQGRFERQNCVEPSRCD
jgi:hypothetical protein